MVRAPILAFPTESGDYILNTDASNFGLGGVPIQIQNDVECVIAYCKYCTTKREMLVAVLMCIQFRSYLRGAKFTLRTDSVATCPTAVPGSSSPSYIEPEVTMETPMDFPVHPLTLADNVLVWTAPRWTRQWWLRTNPLMRFRWENRRMAIWSPCSLVKIG